MDNDGVKLRCIRMAVKPVGGGGNLCCQHVLTKDAVNNL